MMFFTAHGGASGEGRVMTNGLTVAAPFGGGGVSDVTYDTAKGGKPSVTIPLKPTPPAPVTPAPPVNRP